MSELPIHEQLRTAREARGEDLATLARRIGARKDWLRAIDEGRFADLPRGIYARAAVRGYASAVGLDPLAAVAACEALLPSIDDPIETLAVLRGVRQAKRDLPPEGGSHGSVSGSESGHHNGSHVIQSHSGYRDIAAAAIDAAIVMTAMLALVAITAAYCGVPASAFGSGSAPAFAIMGALLAASYFLCVGGVGGATLGQTIVGTSFPQDPLQPSRLDLRAIATRACRCACRDIFVIQHAGASVSHLTMRRRVLAHTAHDDAGL